MFAPMFRHSVITRLLLFLIRDNFSRKNSSKTKDKLHGKSKTWELCHATRANKAAYARWCRSYSESFLILCYFLMTIKPHSGDNAKYNAKARLRDVIFMTSSAKSAICERTTCVVVKRRLYPFYIPHMVHKSSLITMYSRENPNSQLVPLTSQNTHDVECKLYNNIR